MNKKSEFAGLLKGMLAKNLKEAIVCLKNPKKLSRLLTAVIVYVRKNKIAAKSLLNNILLLWEMTNAWFKREYKDIPKKTIALVITALIYFITPIDLIPDWIPGGFLDDAALVTWVIQSINNDIRKFETWKNTNLKLSFSII
jgi:uncharacterized membrane protein YkvA (DUF1232 family)